MAALGRVVGRLAVARLGGLHTAAAHGVLGRRPGQVATTAAPQSALLDGEGEAHPSRLATLERVCDMQHGSLHAAMPDLQATCTPAGVRDLARRLGVDNRTALRWLAAHLVPKPRGPELPSRWTMDGRPAWCWEHDVIPWLNLSYADPAASLATLTGSSTLTSHFSRRPPRGRYDMPPAARHDSGLLKLAHSPVVAGPPRSQRNGLAGGAGAASGTLHPDADRPCSRPPGRIPRRSPSPIRALRGPSDRPAAALDAAVGVAGRVDTPPSVGRRHAARPRPCRC